MGQDLIGLVHQDYERKAQLLEEQGIKTVQLRTGHVLGDRGYLRQVQMMDERGRAFWSKIGSGEQWFPWIHIEDFVRLVCYIVESNRFHGVVNAVAPQAVRQKELAELLKGVLPRKTYKIPMPETVAHWLYPKRAHLLLEGRQVYPTVALQHDFNFKHPTLPEAINSLKGHIAPTDWINPANMYLDPTRKDGKAKLKDNVTFDPKL